MPKWLSCILQVTKYNFAFLHSRVAAEPIGQGGQLPAHFLLPVGKPWCLRYHFLRYWNFLKRAFHVLLCMVDFTKDGSKTSNQVKKQKGYKQLHK